jgi:hypothetical protein
LQKKYHLNIGRNNVGLSQSHAFNCNKKAHPQDVLFLMTFLLE